MTERIYLSPPHMSGNEIKYIESAFSSNWIAPLGPNVDKFEEDMKTYLGSGFPVAVNSGTSAIHVALDLLGVKSGDYVLCSSLTFVASANPILYLGAIPIFIESDLDSWNLCPDSLRLALEDLKKKSIAPKALIAVDLFGQSAKYQEIAAICNEFDIPIIEDSAEALGSSYKGKKCGLFGEYGVFSFNGNKIISTSGGGMLICKTAEEAEKAKYLITQARDEASYYLHSKCGYNYRMSNIIAGIGIAQLQVLDERVKRRREIFEYYKKELSEFSFIKFVPTHDDFFSNCWLSCFYIDSSSDKSPKDIINSLEENNIEARRIWNPLHKQPLFIDSLFYKSGDSISEMLFERGVSLPSGSNLTSEQLERIVTIIKSALKDNDEK